MSFLVLNAKGASLDIEELKIRPYHPTIFVGLNSTLKSYVARTITDIRPNLRDIATEVNLEIAGEEVKCSENAECLHIEDFRLSLRKVLSYRDEIRKKIEDLSAFHAFLAESQAKDFSQEINELKEYIDGMLFGILSDYCDLKLKANLYLYFRLEALFSRVLSDLVNEIKGSVKADEINEANLFPLKVEVICDEERDVKVEDVRLGVRFDSSKVSSSIASAMLFNIYKAFLAMESRKKYRILVIEEPEESMAPPQQALFSRFIEATLNELKGELPPVFVIITTHSPYIPGSFSKDIADTYYFRFDPGSKKFKANKSPPSRPFIFAEVLQPLFVEESE